MRPIIVLSGAERSRRTMVMRRLLRAIALATTLVILASCAPVDLNAPIPAFDTGIDPNAWAQIPAGEFHFGQHEDVETTDAYEIMITDVTTAQYADFLNAALADGYVRLDGEQIVGYYPGDEFRGVKHEKGSTRAIGSSSR
jgi:formylglycine-generating enzyme required for sulfatase activity